MNNYNLLYYFSRSIVSSEISDEEFAELWARTVDLPGFDDNVSPNNTITSLFRCVIGEVDSFRIKVFVLLFIHFFFLDIN